MRVVRRTFLGYWWRVLRAHLSVPTLLATYDEHKVVPIIGAVTGGVAILVISVAAWLSGAPLIFPSLASSAFVLFTRPFAVASSPRSMILGHGIGIACGFFSWWLVSLFVSNSVSPDNQNLALWISADLGFALTCILLIRFSCPHPPACATALVVAVGAMTEWDELLVLMAAVICLAIQGAVIHRLLGVHAPLWRTDPRHEYSE